MINKDTNETGLTQNQVSYLQAAIKGGDGLIELGALAKGLGKRKGNLIRKLEDSFPADWLLKMSTQNQIISGKGRTQTVSTYMLDVDTAVALAMSYNPQLGVNVSKLLRAAMQALETVKEQAEAIGATEIVETVEAFRIDSRQWLTHHSTDTEKETRRTSFRVLSRKRL
ncbi:hypothetical protein [Serratia ureilytica]|uniref:hypothetical protein n=1 Tax=Serratia ureilytica TaxID=300181 RepID=UPI001D1851D4|nr:hypothetical protein [Serratia ureilytica]MCC4108087.1 hypothetical protein [Serratia ureilytica]